MKERIIELMLEADRETVYHTEDGSPYLVREFDVEKFAELIVEECVALCEMTASGRDAEAIQEAIKQHFGVEE